MAHYRIVEWEKYQHYKDRDPPWIKLHRNTLTSRTWVNLDDAGRVLAVACMLIAAGTENKIPADPDYVRRLAYLSYTPDFAPLVSVGFIAPINENKGLPVETLADASNPEQPQANDTECSSESEQSRAEKKPALARKSRLLDDWSPTVEQVEYAKTQGCVNPADTAERFKLHHIAKGTLHQNWNAAFQYWCRNEKNFQRGTSPSPGGAGLRFNN